MRSTAYCCSKLPPIHKQLFAGVATSWMARSSNLCRNKRFYLLQNHLYRHRGQPSLLSNGFSGSFSLVKAAGPEFGHSSTSNIEFKNEPRHISVPPGRTYIHGLDWGGGKIYLLPLPSTGLISQNKCLQNH